MKPNSPSSSPLKLLNVAILACSSYGIAQAGSYVEGTLILDRVKVEVQDTETYFTQLKMQLSSDGKSFSVVNDLSPYPSILPTADAILTSDASKSIYTLTVFNASGYYGVLTATNLLGPYAISSSVGNVDTSGAGVTTGPTGPKGSTGATGPTGAKGDKGDRGNDGADIQGSPGPQGIQGLQGSQGIPGNTGATGPAGKSVLSGVTTPKAEDGSLGDFWFDTTTNTMYGPKGANGWVMPGVVIVGATGATGSAGATGAAGTPGVTGANGLPGVAGATGATGATGSTGATGPTGSQGYSGSQGAKGDTGPGKVFVYGGQSSSPVIFAAQVPVAGNTGNTMVTVDFGPVSFAGSPICTVTQESTNHNQSNVISAVVIESISNTAATINLSRLTPISEAFNIICIGNEAPN